MSAQPLILAAHLKTLQKEHQITEEDIRSSIETDRNSMNSEEKRSSFHMKSQKNIKQTNFIHCINKVSDQIESFEEDLRPLK